jgi:hypothetical protein
VVDPLNTDAVVAVTEIRYQLFETGVTFTAPVNELPTVAFPLLRSTVISPAGIELSVPNRRI